MWASIAAAAISAATSIAGGIIKSRRAKAAAEANQRELDSMKSENEGFYNRNYYADATQLADNRAILTEAADRLRRNSQAAAGRAAVTGATNASVAAAKEANNASYAEMIRNVAANAQQRKNAVQDNYLTNRMNLGKAQMGVTEARNNANAAAIDGAVQGVGTMAKGVISSMGSTSSSNGSTSSSNGQSTSEVQNNDLTADNDPNKKKYVAV